MINKLIKLATKYEKKYELFSYAVEIGSLHPNHCGNCDACKAKRKERKPIAPFNEQGKEVTQDYHAHTPHAHRQALTRAGGNEDNGWGPNFDKDTGEALSTIPSHKDWYDQSSKYKDQAKQLSNELHDIHISMANVKRQIFGLLKNNSKALPIEIKNVFQHSRGPELAQTVAKYILENDNIPTQLKILKQNPNDKLALSIMSSLNNGDTFGVSLLEHGVNLINIVEYGYSPAEGGRPGLGALIHIDLPSFFISSVYQHEPTNLWADQMLPGINKPGARLLSKIPLTLSNWKNQLQKILDNLVSSEYTASSKKIGSYIDGIIGDNRLNYTNTEIKNNVDTLLDVKSINPSKLKKLIDTYREFEIYNSEENKQREKEEEKGNVSYTKKDEGFEKNVEEVAKTFGITQQQIYNFAKIEEIKINDLSSLFYELKEVIGINEALSKMKDRKDFDAAKSIINRIKQGNKANINKAKNNIINFLKEKLLNNDLVDKKSFESLFEESTRELSKHISEFEKGSDFKLNVDKLNSIFDNIQKKFNRFVEISEYIYLFNLNANLDLFDNLENVSTVGGEKNISYNLYIKNKKAYKSALDDLVKEIDDKLNKLKTIFVNIQSPNKDEIKDKLQSIIVRTATFNVGINTLIKLANSIANKYDLF